MKAKACFILLLSGILVLNNTEAQIPVYVVKNMITVDKPVSPLLYGNFIELGFGRCENLWAEMLYNRSFEEDEPFTPSWVEFTRPAKEQEEWWHSGYEQQPWYLVKPIEDTLTQVKKNRGYWPACHSKTHLNIANTSKTRSVLFAQDGIYLRKNIGYHFSGYFHAGNGFGAEKFLSNSVEIKVVLYTERDTTKPFAEKTIKVNTANYGKYEVDFPPVNFEGRATFAIKIPAGTRIGLDFLSLMPADNIKGWRKDVIDIVKSQVPVPVMRFPGGCYASFYDWRDGIGDPYYRPVDLNSFWTSPVINDFGTIEFVEFCREINAEPQLCVPMMFKPIENTLDWLAFCNAPKNELRARYGHPEPLNVRYWELENEMYRTMDAITYAHKCVEFSKAMKAIDPTIKTIMGDYWIYNPKLKEMLEIAGPYIDLINNRGGNIAMQSADMEIIREYNRKNNRSIQLCHTEFRAPLERIAGVSGADELNRVKRTRKESLQNMSARWSFGMSVLDQFIRFQNFGGDYAFLNFTSLNDTWGENHINTAKEGVFISAAGRAQEFICKLPVAYPLEIPDKEKDRELIIQAAWNTDKTRLTLRLLNFSSAVKQCQIDISDLKTRFAPTQKYLLVYSDDIKNYNSPTDKNKIISTENKSSISGSRFKLELKPYSANGWVFEAKP